MVEATLLHAAIGIFGRRSSLRWTLTSWALAITHLGMLEQRHSLGWADAVTLARANMPALSDAQWLAMLALASDLADGRLARALGTETPFGVAADSLADAAFWVWFALRHEPSRCLRAAALLAWLVPVVAVTATSVAGGRMADAPRPVLLRPAAVLQTTLALRAARRECGRLQPYQCRSSHS